MRREIRIVGPGISLNRLNEIVLGKRGITADTAPRLSELLKTSPQLWMRPQAAWDLHRAMQRKASKGVVITASSSRLTTGFQRIPDPGPRRSGFLRTRSGPSLLLAQDQRHSPPQQSY